MTDEVWVKDEGGLQSLSFPLSDRVYYCFKGGAQHFTVWACNKLSLWAVLSLIFLIVTLMFPQDVKTFSHALKAQLN